MSVSDILTNITIKNKHFLSICNISSMSQTSSQGISSPTHPFMRLIRHIRVTAGSGPVGMASVFHTRVDGKFVKLNHNLLRTNQSLKFLSGAGYFERNGEIR